MNTVGVLMLVALFAGIFIACGLSMGWSVATATFIGALIGAAWIVAACYLITS